jgi:hypothetical protein
MARASIGALFGAAAFILAAAPGLYAEESGELPLRKAGRWELKTVMDEGFGPREQVLTMCIDADMERTTAASSDASHKQSCSKYEVKRSGDATTVDALCVFEGRTVESVTEMRGDFKTAFKVTIKSTTSGSEQGRSVSVKRTITQDGKFLGESCGDLKAGEAMGSDGHRIMVQ